VVGGVYFIIVIGGVGEEVMPVFC